MPGEETNSEDEDESNPKRTRREWLKISGGTVTVGIGGIVLIQKFKVVINICIQCTIGDGWGADTNDEGRSRDYFGADTDDERSSWNIGTATNDR